jgi:TatD DNase family protein
VIHQPSWTDTHCHLNDDALVPVLADVLHRARASHVERIICVAVDAKTSRNSPGLFQEIGFGPASGVFFSAGIHPNYAHQEAPGDWDSILRLLDDERIVALGETGLDQYWDDCPLDIQKGNFARHFSASRDTGLPVIIHSRDCDELMMQTLRTENSHGELCGVMHSFTGPLEMAMACIEMGLYISFSGIVSYKKNESLREVASKLPLDRILIETDAPYLSPEPVRATRPNEPALVVHTARAVANARGMELNDLACATTENALRLFQRMR